MSKKTGGPAFPQPAHTSQNTATGETFVSQWTSDGMDLRDYFAAKAMQAHVHGYVSATADNHHLLEVIAENSYAMADAMLKAREQ